MVRPPWNTAKRPDWLQLVEVEVRDQLGPCPDCGRRNYKLEVNRALDGISGYCECGNHWGLAEVRLYQPKGHQK